MIGVVSHEHSATLVSKSIDCTPLLEIIFVLGLHHLISRSRYGRVLEASHILQVLHASIL
jgi:hypothetical protein